jgi:uncharacterized alkaline shock family protein YloU
MQEKELGKVNVSNEAIATIAGTAALQVKGIAGMSAGIIDGIAKLITGKELTKGIKVELKENQVKINVYTIVEYGVSIPDVAWQVQENIKRQVESMTGLDVTEVNVYVQGIHIQSQKK